MTSRYVPQFVKTSVNLQSVQIWLPSPLTLNLSVGKSGFFCGFLCPLTKEKTWIFFFYSQSGIRVSKIDFNKMVSKNGILYNTRNNELLPRKQICQIDVEMIWSRKLVHLLLPQWGSFLVEMGWFWTSKV